MYIHLLKSKIHRATVTETDVDYVGSITIDRNVMEACGLYENEEVHVWDLSNGSRLQTYVIAGEPDSGVICINGAAAHLINKGDMVIIAAYAWVDPKEIYGWKPQIVLVDRKNKIEEKEAL